MSAHICYSLRKEYNITQRESQENLTIIFQDILLQLFQKHPF